MPKIAFIGQKGLPGTWGGVEVHVTAIGTRMAARGHQVWAYVRDWYTPPGLTEFRGVRLLRTPTLPGWGVDTLVHSLTSSLHAAAHRLDVVHYHGIGPAIWSWIPRLSGQTVMLTVHALDYQRAKWGPLGRAVLRLGEAVGLRAAHRVIVVSRHLAEHFPRAVYLPNGVELSEPLPASLISQQYGLVGQDYLLFLGRFEPEKRVAEMVDAFQKLSPRGIRLVVAGGGPPGSNYEARVRALARGNPTVVFPGVVQGSEKRELLSNARGFILPSDLEGLPISLLEAMSHRLAIAASDIPCHREVLESGAGLLFPVDRPQEGLEALLGLTTAARAALGTRARSRALEAYSWETTVDGLEKLLPG